MSKKKLLFTVVVVLAGILMNFIILRYNVKTDNNVSFNITVKSDKANSIQLFYLSTDQTLEDGFSEDQSSHEDYETVGEEQSLSFTVPNNIAYLRLDIGEVGSTFTISEGFFKAGMTKKELSSENYNTIVYENMLTSVESVGNGLSIVTQDGDPHIIWDTSSWGVSDLRDKVSYIIQWALKVIFCSWADIILFFVIKYGKKFVYLPLDLYHNRHLIWDLAKNDFTSRFAGSYLGTIWGFIQPIITVLLYWFVFEKGLRAGGINSKAGITVPFVLWLIAGLVPWLFFQDAWSFGTNALMEYSYLVKKVVFKISILPIIKIISAMFVHIFFVVFALIMYLLYHQWPDVYWLQIIYYSFCTFMLALGLSYITCAAIPFFRDLGQIISVLLQIGTWLTPIFWNYDAMELNPATKALFKLNPMFYVVKGYRDSLITREWFWRDPVLMLYFWLITITILGIGTYEFQKLKKHFADVL